MSLREQQDILARLYADGGFREEFLADPQEIGRRHALADDEIAEIASILPESLNFFAESLTAKRLHEAKKLLPVLSRVLGDAFREAFVAFAAGFNPQTIKKHLEDAVEFSRFVERTDGFSKTAKNTAKFERTGLSFSNGDAKLAVCLIGPDLRQLVSPDSAAKGRMSLAVWVRFRGRQGRFLI